MVLQNCLVGLKNCHLPVSASQIAMIIHALPHSISLTAIKKLKLSLWLPCLLSSLLSLILGLLTPHQPAALRPALHTGSYWRPYSFPAAQAGKILAPAGAAGGLRGLHCTSDGLLFLTVGAAPCVYVLDLEGQSICHLPCHTPRAGAFVPEDVAVTASGLVVVSDLIHGAIYALQHTAQDPQSHWVTVGTFPSPRGLAVDALGRFLVTDYVLGVVHIFKLSPTWEPQALCSVLGLKGPCWVGPGPEGGLAVSEEFGDVQLFGSACQPLGSLGTLTGHSFGCPVGVCSDSEGNIIVADEQRHQVILFPRAGPPICMLSNRLKRPLGVACVPQGRLVVADAGDNCIKVYQYLGELD